MGMGDVAIHGTVVEIDPPHRLVLSWKAAWYPDSQADAGDLGADRVPGAG